MGTWTNRHLRRAIANALLEIKVPEGKAMEFWTRLTGTGGRGVQCTACP